MFFRGANNPLVEPPGMQEVLVTPPSPQIPGGGVSNDKASNY